MRRELCFTAFNRVDYLQSTVESWNKVRNLKNWNTTFFVEPSPLQIHITNVLNQLNTTVVAKFNSERLGVLTNPWHALNTLFESGVEFAVLAEDDVVVSSDCLEYLEWASDEYQRDQSVLAINLFSQVGGPKPNEIMRDGKFSPLVWGIWKDRWIEHLRDTWDKDYSSGNSDGSEAGWDWNINRILSNKQLDIIKPLQSRSDHIGEFAGTHMTPELFGSSRGVDFKQSRGRQIYTEI